MPVGVNELPCVLVTVAVNFTDWPNVDGSADEVTGGLRRLVLVGQRHGTAAETVDREIVPGQVDRRTVAQGIAEAVLDRRLMPLAAAVFMIVNEALCGRVADACRSESWCRSPCCCCR